MDSRITDLKGGGDYPQVWLSFCWLRSQAMRMGTPRLGLNREKCLLKTYLSRDQILVEGSQDLERLSEHQEGIQRGHRLHHEGRRAEMWAGLRSVPRALGGNGGAGAYFQSWLRVEGMEAKALC